MDNYEFLCVVGQGTYGIVYKSRHKETGQIVAVKKFKETEEDERVRRVLLREVRMLKGLRHDNIINLLEVFRRKGKLHLVFEFAETTILDVLAKSPAGLEPDDVRSCMYQLLRGVEYCHAHSIVHRDVKPENILLSRHGSLKLCDFGFARRLSGPGSQYTDYVATRWYRCPELLVGDTEYGKEVDVWAIGCILAEISTGLPLFPGESDIDQLFLIVKCFGQLTDRQAHIFRHNPLYAGIDLPNPVELDTLDKRFGASCERRWLHLLKCCLANNPVHRIACTELLTTPYFAERRFAEKYEEELKGIMERDAAANMMRQKRQKHKKKKRDRDRDRDHRDRERPSLADEEDGLRDSPPPQQEVRRLSWLPDPEQSGFPMVGAVGAAAAKRTSTGFEPSAPQLPVSPAGLPPRPVADPASFPDLASGTPRVVPVCMFPQTVTSRERVCEEADTPDDGSEAHVAHGSLPSLGGGGADPTAKIRKKRKDKGARDAGEDRRPSLGNPFGSVGSTPAQGYRSDGAGAAER